jgi:hypothetical protein
MFLMEPIDFIYIYTHTHTHTYIYIYVNTHMSLHLPRGSVAAASVLILPDSWEYSAVPPS